MKYQPIEIPDSYQYQIDGLYYKVGIHGYVYLFVCGKWLKSSKTTEDLAVMRGQERKHNEQKQRNVAYMNRRYHERQPEIAERKRIRAAQAKKKEVLARKNKVRGRT